MIASFSDRRAESSEAMFSSSNTFGQEQPTEER